MLVFMSMLMSVMWRASLYFPVLYFLAGAHVASEDTVIAAFTIRVGGTGGYTILASVLGAFHGQNTLILLFFQCEA